MVNNEFDWLKKITTPLNWSDLVVAQEVLEELNEILNWLKQGDALLKDWNLNNKIKPGYRVLLYGEAGTGKTLATTILGKESNKDVYRIDLQLFFLKYQEEAVKKLSIVFEMAAENDWILFLDEADALFSPQASNNRQANQQIGHLFQCIDDFSGVVILTSTLKTNIDEAFFRRFQAMIHFDMPSSDLRYQLWQNAFSNVLPLSDDIDFHQIAQDYEVTGGAINNILRHCALAVSSRSDTIVLKSVLLDGIKREFKKENKTINFK